MNAILVFEQLLNGAGYGLMLFLIAAGLTLVFGVMDVLNLSHGSLFMVGRMWLRRCMCSRARLRWRWGWRWW